MTQNPTLSEREALKPITPLPAPTHGGELWKEITALFERHGLSAPPWRLRDELVNHLSWAQYGNEVARRAPVAPAEPVAWNEDMTAAPKNGPDFLAKNAKGDIRRCWRTAPSSRTDEIRTFSQQKFAAVAWMPLDAIERATPAQPSTVTAEGWKLVPVEATVDMMAAYCRQMNTGTQEVGERNEAGRYQAAAYRAMLAAAPAPPAPSPVTPEEIAKACVKCNAPRSVRPCFKCGGELVDPADGWEWPDLPDIDRIRALAREVGYGVGVHGSLERDLDLIAIPWTDDAVSPPTLAAHIAAGLPGRVVDDVVQDKPNGRWSCNIDPDGWFKLIDLSVMPPPASPVTGALVLWAVHVRGPDDFYAAADYEAAVKLADWCAAEDRKNAMNDLAPRLSAMVALWPFSADAHAENLAAQKAEG